jgi:hypothetical protein
MDTFVLTCKESKDRLETLEERLNKGGIYEYRIFNAMEYSEDSDRIIKALGNGKDWFNCSLMKNEKKIKARKSVYLSHLSILAYCMDNDINEVLVLEDDIVFKDIDITEELKDIPNDCFVATFDRTWIRGEGFPQKNGFWKIGKGLEAWGLCCYYCTDVNRLFNYLTKQRPKVIDKLYVQLYQNSGECYLYFDSNKKIRQSHDFISTINVK